jgi:hypothetical protein
MLKCLGFESRWEWGFPEPSRRVRSTMAPVKWVPVLFSRSNSAEGCVEPQSPTSAEFKSGQNWTPYTLQRLLGILRARLTYPLPDLTDCPLQNINQREISLYLILIFSFPTVGRNVYNFRTCRVCFDKAILKRLFLIIHSHLSAFTKQLQIATLSFATTVRWSPQNTANPTAGIFVKFHICDVY